MAALPERTVRVTAEVKPKVGIGASTVAGGSVTLVAFVLAVIAFVDGARDEATISAMVVGAVALVTTLAGRYAQAVAAINAAHSNPPQLVPVELSGQLSRGVDVPEIERNIALIHGRLMRLERAQFEAGKAESGIGPLDSSDADAEAGDGGDQEDAADVSFTPVEPSEGDMDFGDTPRAPDSR